MRIARALSSLGYCSRREADRLIEQRRVAVNGEILQTPVALVDVERDAIAVDGVTIGLVATMTYALYKPVGVTSTVRDPHAGRTVVQLVDSPVRLYPVGRLDKESEGLILLTNDGELAQRVTHPRYGVEKEYEALVDRVPEPATLDAIRAGVVLDGRPRRPLRVAAIQRDSGAWVRLVLAEGINHEVRRILGVVGLSVRRLVRTRIGPVRLGRLRPGGSRLLSSEEIEALNDAKRSGGVSGLNSRGLSQ
ncbi:MAG TPA: pseudouridine synthase [Chloroflexota bacterium]